MMDTILCHIPEHAVPSSPVILNSSLCEGGSASLSPQRVILERGAKATVIHTTSSKEGAAGHFPDRILEIVLEEGAELIWIDQQSLGSHIESSIQQKVILKKDARLQWFSDIDGGGVFKNHLECVLQGEGADAKISGLLRGRQKQHLEFSSLTRHVAPHTSADILVKTTARDEARTVFQGLIRIEKQAQQTESYMANHNLILSEKAHVDSVPRLEIEADDVKASHGATIGQIDAEQLFYLKTRGLQGKEAEELLVEGFCEEILGRLPPEALRAWAGEKPGRES